MAPKNVWRLLFLQTHPRSPLDYSPSDKEISLTEPSKILEQAKSSWNRINNALGELAEYNDAKSEAALMFEAIRQPTI